MSISLPYNARRVADGSHRMVALVENFCIDAVMVFFVVEYAGQFIRSMVSGLTLNLPW